MSKLSKISVLGLAGVLTTGLLVAISPMAEATPVSPAYVSAVPSLTPPRIPLGIPAGVRVVRDSATSLRLSWEQVNDVSGYVVYRWNVKKRKYVNIKTIESGTKTGWIDKKLKTGKKYRYKIAAYRLVDDDKKQIGGRSYWVSALAYKKNAQIVNAGTILAEDYNVSILKPPFEIPNRANCIGCGRAYPLPSKLSKAKEKRVFNQKLRVSIVDGHDIVSMNTVGDITPKTFGSARIRLMAHNGNSKTVTVNVQDYSRPEFWLKPYKEGTVERLLLENYVDELSQIASIAQSLILANPDFFGGMFRHDDAGELICERDISPDNDLRKQLVPCVKPVPQNLLDAVDELLTAFPYPMRVDIGQRGAGFTYWLTSDREDSAGKLEFHPIRPEPRMPMDGEHGMALVSWGWTMTVWTSGWIT